MDNQPTNKDLLEIIVRLENRIHETRMASFSIMRALSIFAKAASLDEGSYNEVKAAILDAAAQFKTSGSDEN